jgi:hypothetical protein
MIQPARAREKVSRDNTASMTVGARLHLSIVVGAAVVAETRPQRPGPTARTRDAMPLDAKLRQRLDAALAVVDDHGTAGPRLKDDAKRLWRRVEQFVDAPLVTDGVDRDALELACFAMQLPLKRRRTAAGGRPVRINLRARAEEAAELLINAAAEEAGEVLLDRTIRILHEVHHRSPMLDEAKLLADAINLDDFGVTGLLLQMIQLVRDGDGMLQLVDGATKREQYGYWEARLKDGFHFEPVRDLARRRIDGARLLMTLLMEELDWSDQS